MKKYLTLLICCLLLTGCGKTGPNDNLTVKWEDGTFSINGDVQNVTKYAGYTAEYEGAISGTIFLDQCDSLEFATLNTEAILTENMDRVKGDAYGWTTNQMTLVNLYKSVGENYYVAMQVVNPGIDANTVYNQMYEVIDSLHLTNGTITVDFGEFKIMSPYQETMKVTSSGCSITGVIKVTKETKAECTEPVQVTTSDGKTVLDMTFYTNGSYDYYQYGDYVLKTYAGGNIGAYIL